jgi:beta-lactam-binding protein with PASTA domain
VVTQDPKEHQRAPEGASVRVLVSGGVEVPDLMGRQCRDARAALGEQGWAVRPVHWRFANRPDFGKVVAQEPAAGAVVADKQEIRVEVAGPVAPC